MTDEKRLEIESEFEFVARVLSTDNQSEGMALVRERDTRIAEQARREALTLVLGKLEAMEWRDERTMAGTMNKFCPICGGTPSVYALNKRTCRPDGHWRNSIRLGATECPLATLLDDIRAMIDAKEGEA